MARDREAAVRGVERNRLGCGVRGQHRQRRSLCDLSGGGRRAEQAQPAAALSSRRLR